MVQMARWVGCILLGTTALAGCGSERSIDGDVWLRDWMIEEAKANWQSGILDSQHLEVYLADNRKSFDVVAHLEIRAAHSGVRSLRLGLDSASVSLVQIDGRPQEFEYDGGWLQVELSDELTHDQVVPLEVVYRIGAVGDTSLSLLPEAYRWTPTTGAMTATVTRTDFYLPTNYTGVGAGRFVTSERRGGKNLVVWATPWSTAPVCLVGPLAAQTEVVADVPVHLFVAQDHTDVGKRIAEELIGVFRLYSDLLGEQLYPFEKLALVEVSRPVDSMVYPSVILLTSDEISGPETPLKLKLAYRLARQWWGMALPTIGLPQDWWADGMARLLAALWADEAFGHDAFAACMARQALVHLDGVDSAAPKTSVIELLRGSTTQETKDLLASKAAWMWQHLRSTASEPAFIQFCESLLSNRTKRYVDTKDVVAALGDATNMLGVDWLAEWASNSALPRYEISCESGTANTHCILKRLSGHKFDVQVGAKSKDGSMAVKTVTPTLEGISVEFREDGEPLEVVVDPNDTFLRSERRGVYQKRVQEMNMLWE